MTLKTSIIKLRWFLVAQLGINPVLFLKALIGFPLYLADWLKFRRGYAGHLKLMPCLSDRDEEGGRWWRVLLARFVGGAMDL